MRVLKAFGKGGYRWLLVVVLIVTFVILKSKVMHIESSPPISETPWALETVVAVRGQVTNGFPALGVVRSSSEVRITPQISGTVLELGAREGERVEKGDLLAHLDTRLLEASKAALESKLKSVRASLQRDLRELQRERQLLKHGGSSRSAVEAREVKVDAGRSAVRSLLEQIRQLDVKIAHGHIRSPLAARVARRMVEVGDTAMPGRTMYVLSSAEGGRVTLSLPLPVLRKVEVGTEVILSEAGTSQKVSVSRVNPSLDKWAMGSVEIDLPERPFGLPDGARISARVLVGKAIDRLVVPSGSVVGKDGRIASVFVVRHEGEGDWRLARESVEVEVCGIEGCAVSGGIKVGDRVVIAHPSIMMQLRDGDPVLPFTARMEALR